ncbi:MAG TPA: hypothetical protein DDW87_11695 [Firmicutes bacterium]|nr:hypothetical protein [Bacillota bacterium]
MAEGRYTRIKSRFWTDEKTRTWNDDTKFLALYILTSPHNNILGCFVLPKLYICADLGWESKKLSKPFNKLLQDGFIQYDEGNCLLFISKYLLHNPIDNPNQATGAIKVLEELPTSSVMLSLKQLLEQFCKPFLEPLIQQLAERIGKPVTVTITVTETVNNPPVIPPEKKPEKVAYSEYVYLTPAEHERLLLEFGEADTSRMIEILDNYIGAEPRKRNRYTDHNRVIRGWVKESLLDEKDKRRGSPTRQAKPTTDDIVDQYILGGG